MPLTLAFKAIEIPPLKFYKSDFLQLDRRVQGEAKSGTLSLNIQWNRVMPVHSVIHATNTELSVASVPRGRNESPTVPPQGATLQQ